MLGSKKSALQDLCVAWRNDFCRRRFKSMFYQLLRLPAARVQTNYQR